MKLGKQPKEFFEYGTVYYEIVKNFGDVIIEITDNYLIYRLSNEIGDEVSSIADSTEI